MFENSTFDETSLRAARVLLAQSVFPRPANNIYNAF